MSVWWLGIRRQMTDVKCQIAKTCLYPPFGLPMGLPAHTDPHKKLHAFAWSFLCDVLYYTAMMPF